MLALLLRRAPVRPTRSTARRWRSFAGALTVGAACLALAMTARESLALAVTSFSPAGAPPGSAITVMGSGFASATAVYFNGFSAPFSVVDDGHINTNVPGSATTGPIRVTDGVNNAYSPTSFFVGNAPSLSYFTPTGGTVGASVTIYGGSFVGVSSVRFNGVAALFTTISTSQITATVPAGATSGPVTVTNPAGTASVGWFYFPPIVTSFAPAGGQSGTPVTIHGRNFAIAGSVSFFSGVGASCSVQNDSTISTYVPSSAVTGPIQVASLAGTGTSSTTFFVGPAPSVSDVFPAGGPPGTVVQISGANFASITTVTFNGAPAMFQVQSASLITATIPGAGSSGSLVVTNPSGSGVWASAFYVGGLPAIAGFTPAAAPAGGTVAISGSGLAAVTEVRFNGVSAASFVAGSDNSLSAIVPVGASTGKVSVVNPAGTATSAAVLAVLPRLLSSSPTSVSASTATGTVVTITGNNFSGAIEVLFNGVPAAFIENSDTQLTSWVPAGVTTGPLSVSTLAGTGTSPFSFEIVTFVPPPHQPFASWPTALAANLPVAVAAGAQDAPVMCSDSTGGVYVAWEDTRGGDFDIYLQRLTAYGEVAPGWPTNGLKICGAAGDQTQPQAVADLVGGVIVTWTDRRAGSADVYATRIQADGSRPQGWANDGNAICTAQYDQAYPALTTDGASGAIVAWQDLRSNYRWQIYVQHVTANGVVGSGWDNGGVCLSSYYYYVHAYAPTLVPDQAGGAFVAWWNDYGWASAERITSGGLLGPGWPASGFNFGGNNYYQPALVADGAGNAIMVFRNGGVYAVKLPPDGSGGVTWSHSVNNGSSDAYASPVAVSDGGGGVLVAWQSSSTAISAQHLTSLGTPASGWGMNGMNFGYAPYGVAAPRIAADGYGGAVVTWAQNISGDYDLYAQRLLAGGSIASGWTSTGMLVCSAPGAPALPAVTYAGSEAGVVVAWADPRSGNYDLYAQNIGLSGRPGNPEPHITSVKDVPADQGGHTRITWQRSLLDTLPSLEVGTYGVWRQMNATQAQAALRSGRACLAAASGEVIPGSLRRTRVNALDVYWEALGSISTRGQLTYSFVVGTLADSGSGGRANETYMVDAHAQFGPYFWSSEPDSGHSVDNLAPAVPLGLTATSLAGATHIHWHANVDRDLAHYEVYRGGLQEFTPSAATLLGTTTDTSFVDPQSNPAIYKLVARDIHENASGAATLLPTSMASADAGGALAFALAMAGANPVRDAARLRLALPSAARVEAGVYDAGGRRVKTLVSGALPAGATSLEWDLRDDAHTRVADGLYFLRCVAAGRTRTCRVVVMH